MHANNVLPIKRIVPEQGVLLESKNSCSNREGRFDFLVLTQQGKTIGFEVLSRPSHGKLKEKLSYAREVDEFVFVLPSDALAFYRKTKTKPFKQLARDKFLDNDFCDAKIKAWLLDLKTASFEAKGEICKLFNVKKQ